MSTDYEDDNVEIHGYCVVCGNELYESTTEVGWLCVECRREKENDQT